MRPRVQRGVLVSAETVVGAIAGAFAVLATVAAFAAFLYGMALVAQYRDTVGRTIRNALLFPAAEPVRTIGIVVIPVTAICLVMIFPAFVVLLLTVGCSVGAYLAAMIFRSVFARRTT